MTTLHVDGRAYQVDAKGRNLLEVCLSLGLNIPYFCWHPAFRSVGACRQCAVKVYKDAQDTRGRIEMSCMIPVGDTMRISIQDPEVVAFRRKIIEWLMVNHPHDCPVCDEGGECHLQDMTLMTGHVHRRYRFTKRTYRNQDLGPLVNMEMSRCIQCYRCVRFYRDYAGGRDFTVLGWHDHVYFGRHADGLLESPFSGNLVEVCPTGVFTDKSLKRHYTRKWDLQTAPSVCPHCGLGCNTLPGERYGLLRRIMPRYNGQVNGYFICDRGRYGYGFVNGPRRLREPLMRTEGKQTPVLADDAIRTLATWVQAAGAWGIGSPRASMESNDALLRLVGPARFVHGLAAPQRHLLQVILDTLRTSPARTPSLREVESCDAVLILGEDVGGSAPMLELAIRQAVLQQPRAQAIASLKIHEWLDVCLREAMQDARGPLIVATPAPTSLDTLAKSVHRQAPADIARLGFAVAEKLAHAQAASNTDSASAIAADLLAAHRPLVVAGAGCRSEAIVYAASAVARALIAAGREARLCLTVPECNSLGTVLLPGGSLDDVQAAVRASQVKTLVVLENDLFRRLPENDAAALLGGVQHVVVLDAVETPTAARAELVLPSGSFAESSGTYVNNEGRAQRFFQVLSPAGQVRDAWRWLARAAEPDGDWPRLDDVIRRLTAEHPALAALADAAPSADYRQAGRRVPRQHPRYSGRTAITANIDVQEPKPPEDLDSPLAFSMEGSTDRPPAALLPRVWAPQWNSVQALNKFQMEVGGPLRGGDPGRRLIEPPRELATAGPCVAPDPLQPASHAWLLLLPSWHVFGTDELSALADPVAELAVRPHVAMNPDDLARSGLKDGQTATVRLDSLRVRLPVLSRPGLVSGVALVPAGAPGMPELPLPARATIEKEAGEPT